MTKTIMIVDDSASMRHVVDIALRGAGYEVIEACDGGDAISKLSGRKVHLIISDVNMPNMDGITFVKTVRTLPEHKFAPIIMLTANFVQSEQYEQAKAEGVKAWMVKPFDGDQLLDVVSRLALP